jgi:hypothetical protein
MSVHPDYAKLYNQSRDIRRIVIRSETRLVPKADRERLSAIADDLRKSADLVKSGGYLIAILHWPEDPDRGQEVYGPFESEETRAGWFSEVMAAAEAGDSLLAGVHFILTRMDIPFQVQR